MAGIGPRFLDGLTEITRNAITHANICNKMILAGFEPPTLTPIAQTPTQLTKMVAIKRNIFTKLKPKRFRNSTNSAIPK